VARSADSPVAGVRLVVRWYLRLVRRHVGPGPYLDVGCGSGELLRRLAAHGSASGYEPSAETAAAVRSAAPGCPVHTGRDEVPSAVFRGVVAVHPSDGLDPAALAFWRRVLVPGDRALVVTAEAGARQALVDAGFTVVREGGVGRRAAGRLRALPAHLQTLSGRLVLKAGGDASVFVVQAPAAVE
jgi:SAM-dependent methyltransferase